MNNFTFLTNEQIFGNNKLDIIKHYGTKCTITDFSILLGGSVSLDYYTRGGNTKKDRTGWWWTKTPYANAACFVDQDGNSYQNNVDMRSGGARPALPYSSIQRFSSNEVRVAHKINEIKYGEYPQTIVDEDYSLELEIAFANMPYSNNEMKATGRIYTTDSVSYQDFDTSFKARAHTEYEYKGSKYIRFVGDSNCDGEFLSDGRKIQSERVYWVNVEPITWIVDEKADIALCKKIIFSGVQFDDVRNYKGDFKKTNIYRFMNTYLAKEIIPDRVYTQTTLVEQIQSIKGNEPVRKQNPYNFNFEEVSEEDIIRGAIESNVSVFLHGKSSEGKSSRVKQLDPDCEIIYMRNATPDSLNGKSVYVPPITKRVAIPVRKTVISNETKVENVIDTYEYEDVVVKEGYMLDVKPSWLMKIEEKCEVEPNKIHIIFFDELTNALPSIQGMAFNIILDGEVNGKWKIPANARIVAAGNNLNDSLAANQMAEPLFNRFAHVYIQTTVDSWLKWASTPKEKYERLEYKEEEQESKIHPSIYAYIAYKSYSGHDVLRTPYTGDKPNADPRKWEMASKILYKTKQPEMLRALIGEELTRDFIAFARQQVISVEDVINHNYSERDLEMDISQKFATAVGLSSVDDEHFEEVREFMQQVGAEPRAAFEAMWTHKDEKRLERLAELQITDSLSQGGIRR